MPKIVKQACARGQCGEFVKMDTDPSTCRCATESMTKHHVPRKFLELDAMLAVGGEKAAEADRMIAMANEAMAAREIEQQPLERGIAAVALHRVNDRVGLRA